MFLLFKMKENCVQVKKKLGNPQPKKPRERKIK